jgi:hypothetical protein
MLTKKEYENIIVKNDKFTEDTLIALGLVKKYVCKNKLLIVGGMAIDFALRLKGEKLYEDDILPDYDFYSPNYNTDAYHIAEKLKKAGLENISVINANHVSTMRVRVNYTVVADVTYMPKNIFDKLPFLVYRDIRIIHPHFQLIDQHRALSYPYENPPWEVITHRWEKDAARYDLLYEYYPLKSKDFEVSKDVETSKNVENIETIIPLMKEITITSIMFKDQCISGFASLLYWEGHAKKLGYKNKNISIGAMHEDSGGFIFQIPMDSHGISIYSNNVIQFRDELKKKESIETERCYNRFLDKLPYKFILNSSCASYELFDNGGYMLSAYKTDIGIYITNLQNIMLYMLTNIILLKNIKETNRGYSFYIGYITAQSIVKWAGENYTNKKPNTKYMPFLPSVEVYGTEEMSDSYINSKRQFLEKIKEREPVKIQPDIIFNDTFDHGKIPEKYYKFDFKKSPILQFDGSESNKYQKRIYL